MRPFFRQLLWLTLALPLLSHAIEEQHVRDKAHTVYGLYLTPFEAYNMKIQQADQVLLVDVRTRPELKYVGAGTVIDANIPSRFLRTDFAWSERSQTYRTTQNDHFVADMEKLLQVKNADKNTPIILMCTSGSRVPSLAKKLQAAGFTTVYSLYQGFEGIKHKDGVSKGWRTVDGWKNAGLPWSYKLNKQAMYFNFDSTQTGASD
ncbi:MAG: rhodanese-like domain-containing protein [Gammaproteobacteria bacterium]|nr:rhodanese-like domain-containing protein [Gammaproteobacteria bacterium]